VSERRLLSSAAILKAPVVFSVANIVVLIAGPVSLFDDLAVHSLTLVSQVDLLGLFNTYVTSISFSVTRSDPTSIVPRLQRVMHSILAARVLLHVRDALQKDLHKTGETNIKFEHDTNDTGTGSS
jgi:hypothetical protein